MNQRLDPSKIYEPANYQLSRCINRVSRKYNNALYNLPKSPSLLSHKKLNLIEKIKNLWMSISFPNGFKCIICGRREINGIGNEELRIVGCTCDNKIGLEMSHDFCDIGGTPIVVCYLCVEDNKPIFEPVSNLEYLEWCCSQSTMNV